ncbi:MAG: DUF4249 family protein [Bacteroidales bacterium]|nr:DUF4249 family protein [Bacteroidales bacterium]
MSKRRFLISHLWLSGITLLATVLTYSACTEKIDLTLDKSFSRIVIEGSITDEEKAHTVKLTTSTDYFYNQSAPPVTGAVVTISDSVNTFLLSETSPGIYQTDTHVAGVPGKTYTLTINGVDINGDGNTEQYTASEKMRFPLILDSITTAIQNPGQHPPLYNVSGWGQEPPTLNDAYQWVYYINGTLITDTLSKTIFTNDQLVNGSYIPGLMMFENIKAAPGDTLTVETRSITQQYLDFLINLMTETLWNMGSVGGPPANIIGNVDNGGLGYFSARSVNRCSNVLQ